jgi:hypothetical protein
MANNRELSQFGSYVTVNDTNKTVGIATTVNITAGGLYVGGIQAIRSDGTWGGSPGGIQGIQGAQGFNGSEGTQGIQGIQGAQGFNGSEGTQGIQGAQGFNGSSGTQGAQGAQGITGTGTQGIQGASGSGGSLTDDTTTNATRYPVFDDVTSGEISGLFVSSTKLQFNPSTGTLSATVFTSLSDRTQKTNIRPIENAVETVKQLEGVKYDWIDNHSQSSIGVIAQDIEKVLPEVVIENPGGLKSVSYGNIVGVLIEAIKEQQVRIEELERKLNA